MSHSSDDDSADEPEIQYGIRRSRRGTSYEYRDSSSLAPAERMEQETYYNAAEVSLERSFLVASQMAKIQVVALNLFLVCIKYRSLPTLFTTYRRLAPSLSSRSNADVTTHNLTTEG
jgi:hypothetical protein